MAHWRTMTDNKYIHAGELMGRDVNVRIAKVSGATVDGVGGKKAKKPLIFFEGKQKPLIGNATNCKAITSIVGDPDVNKWIGQWITLYPTTTQSTTGETVDCIRIRPRAPTKGLPTKEQQDAEAAADAASDAAEPADGAEPEAAQ